MHYLELGSQYLMCGCTNNRIDNTCACQAHQAEWHNYTKYRTCQTQSGVCRMLQRPRETQPWNPQHHNSDNGDPPPSKFFSPAQYYCIETIYALCGVVIALTKFARSELTTNILQFLKSVYQTEVIFVLTKVVKFSRPLWVMKVGMKFQLVFIYNALLSHKACYYWTKMKDKISKERRSELRPRTWSIWFWVPNFQLKKNQ